MDTSKSKPGWQSGETHTSLVRYWGDQTGPREQELKIELIAFFKSFPEIQTAYLAKMGKNDDPPTMVALCIRALYDPNIVPINTRIGEIYAALFNRNESIEIVYLTEKAEAAILTVCQPFYERYPLLPHERERLALTAVVCEHVACRERRILHAARIKPQGNGDSGWRFYCKSGYPEDEARNKVVTVQEVLKLEPDVAKIIDSPQDTFLWRPTPRMKWEHVKANGESNGHGLIGNGRNGHGDNGESNNIGNGMFSANGEVNFVREQGKPFDRGMSPPPDLTPEDNDPIREYVKLKAGWPHPVEIALYYECFGCGEILSSASAGEAKCRCGNIAISSGVVKIENLAKASAFRQR